MTTFSLIAGGTGIAVIFLWLYGVAKKRQGRAQEKLKNLKGEIETVKQANKIEEDHKHDPNDLIIKRL